MGYDSAWISYFPVMRFRDSRTIVDIFGRLNDVAIDEKGNLTNPVYGEGLITGPETWKAWDKRDMLRLPDKVNSAFTRLNKKYGDEFSFSFSAATAFLRTSGSPWASSVSRWR
ncbi:MAG: hypothetical protein SWK76_06835 [Actinomycetota bacterium]|nr:hypothetical protein [Actinomycetota bacterium]